MPNAVFMQPLLDALPVGVVLIDESSQVVFFNKYEETLAGRNRTQVVGRDFFEEVAPCTKVVDLGFEFRDQLMEGTLSRKLMFRFPRPYLDRARDVQLTLEPLDVLDRRYGLLMVEDVSHVRSVERTKDFLVRMLAHDMNNPLTTITGTLDLIALDRESNGLVNEARLAATSLRDMVLNLFDITRLEGADVPSEVAPCDLTTLLQAALAAARTNAPPGVRLTLDVPDTLLAEIDEQLVRRAVDNLLTNALHASPPAGSVALRAWIEGERALVEVQDEGPGVAEALRNSLFEPFVTSGGAGHRGLGLAFVDLVAREHGGTITFDCPPEGGSVFSLALPVEPPQRDEPNDGER